MKKLLRTVLKHLRLLGFVREILYCFTRFNRNSKNPRRAMYFFYAQFVKKGDLCFDAGASDGDRSEIFLELGARVVCIEPQEKYISILRKKFKRTKNAVIVPRCIADKEGFLNMAVCSDFPEISTMSDSFVKESIFTHEYRYSFTDKEKVSVTTLDALILQYGMPAFCKIDVEGFEEHVLQGLTQPVPLLSFEFSLYSDTQRDAILRCVRRLLSIGSYKFNFALAEPTDGRGLILPQWTNEFELYAALDALRNNPGHTWGDIYAKHF